MANALGLITQSEGFTGYRGIMTDEESSLEHVASESELEDKSAAGRRPPEGVVVHVFQLIMISLIFMTVLSWIEVIFPNDPLLDENVTPKIQQRQLQVRYHKTLVFALSLTGIVVVLGIILHVTHLLKIAP
jgi:hypothetical protein